MAKPGKTSDAEILTVEEVATFLKVTERSIYTLLTRQEIPAFKVGGSWRFSRKELENWIKSQQKTRKRRSA